MRHRLGPAVLVVATLSTMFAPPPASARTVYPRTVTLAVRAVEGELIATGRVYTPDPKGYTCIRRVPIIIRTHASGATEWSSAGDPHATTDQYGRFRIELPLDSSWAKYRALVDRQKYHDVRKACARAVSPTSEWPKNPITLRGPVSGATLGPETTFRIGVGNPAGVESVSFKIYPAGTSTACPRRDPDNRDYEAPYEWTWRPQTASHEIVLGVAAWGQDGFAVCREWPFRVGELGSLMWWGIDQLEEKTNLGKSSDWFKTEEGRVPAVGYFDQDRAADIFWYSPQGEEEIWWGAGGSFVKDPSQLTLGPGLTPTVGNFDNDAYDDIIWYAPGSSPETGTDSIWWGAPGRTWEVSHVPQMTGVWDQLVAGDYNGDGYDDVFFVVNDAKTDECAGTKNQVYWWGKDDRDALNSGATSSSSTKCYYHWFSADFDGDNWGDLLAYGQNPNHRDSLTWRNPHASETFNLPYGMSPFTGDFNGDTKDDIFWFWPGGRDRQWWGPSRPASGSSEFVPEETFVEMNGDFEPISADFDGDGDDDILWYER